MRKIYSLILLNLFMKTSNLSISQRTSVLFVQLTTWKESKNVNLLYKFNLFEWSSYSFDLVWGTPSSYTQ